MRRSIAVFFMAFFAFVAGMPAAVAGSPHFVNNAFTVTRSDNTLTVTGKEAGLGDEDQIHVVLEATALCINGGGNHPKAVNKADVTAEGDFPVQNGRRTSPCPSPPPSSPSAARRCPSGSPR